MHIAALLNVIINIDLTSLNLELKVSGTENIHKEGKNLLWNASFISYIYKLDVWFLELYNLLSLSNCRLFRFVRISGIKGYICLRAVYAVLYEWCVRLYCKEIDQNSTVIWRWNQVHHSRKKAEEFKWITMTIWSAISSNDKTQASSLNPSKEEKLSSLSWVYAINKWL